MHQQPPEPKGAGEEERDPGQAAELPNASRRHGKGDHCGGDASVRRKGRSPEARLLTGRLINAGLASEKQPFCVDRQMNTSQLLLVNAGQ